MSLFQRIGLQFYINFLTPPLKDQLILTIKCPNQRLNYFVFLRAIETKRI